MAPAISWKIEEGSYIEENYGNEGDGGDERDEGDEGDGGDGGAQ